MKFGNFLDFKYDCHSSAFPFFFFDDRETYLKALKPQKTNCRSGTFV